MAHKTLAPFLILLTHFFFPQSLFAESAMELLAEKSPQSLRGESIDIDDRWSGSRLLALFGEHKLAYDVLRQRASDEVVDPEVERFEARVLSEIGLYQRADSVLALQTYSGSGEHYYTLCLQRARLNLLSGRPERALEFLALIDSIPFPAFEPYKDLVAVEALRSTGRFEDACDVGEKRLVQGIPLSLSPRFEEQLLDTYVEWGEFEKGLGLIEILKARRTRSSKLAPVLIAEVDLLFVIGDTIRATERGMALMKDRRTRHLAVDIAEALTLNVPVDEFPDEALLEMCGMFLHKGRLGDAKRLITALDTRVLDQKGRERHMLYRADVLYREKRYSKSFKLLQNEFSEDSLERTAKLLRARIFRKTGQRVRAADAYVAFATSFPYDAKAAEALYVASEMYLQNGNREKAMKIFDRVIDVYPTNKYAKRSTMHMAFYHIERRQLAAGASILEKSLQRSGRTSEEMLYYLSDTYRRMGKTEKESKIEDEIREVNPNSFYLDPAVESTFDQPITSSNGRVALYGSGGLLEFLKITFEQRQRAYTSIRNELGALEDDGRLQTEVRYLERGRQFLQMGFRDWAEVELHFLESTRHLPPRVSFELGILYDDYAIHWKSVRSFQRVYYSFIPRKRKELESYFAVLMHPIPYPALVFENCARYGVSPHLVYAMMRKESMFDLNAVSRAGAMGLMQLMPSTGEQVAIRLGVPDGVEPNLLSPDVNLTFGIWYASHLLNRSNDDALMMLSAYNAGFGNAKRWFRGSEQSSIAKVDGIDYGETREYVKRVVEAAHIYHDFYFVGHDRGPVPD
ncbi:MAG: transglycosylase SLT domain-containing protein [bacterium]|nr:transglycosylase SLT domain-containing protein [bacterium]